MNTKRLLFIVALVAAWGWQGHACTNFLLTRGSTSDGSTMITYAADSHTRYGQLRFHPSGTHQPGEMLSLYNYGSLKHQIDIPQAARTYRVRPPGAASHPSAKATSRASTTATLSTWPCSAPATAAKPSA